MSIKKVAKTHTSSRKKASATSSTKLRTKKASANASKRAGESKQKLSDSEWLKLRERTLKMFQMVYDDYQQGKFHRLF